MGRGTEEDHGARDSFENDTEVFGSHDRVGQFDESVAADDVAHESGGDRCVVVVVDGDVVADVEVDLDLKVVRRCDSLGDSFNAVVHRSSGRFTDGSNRAADLGDLGNHVERCAGMKFGDGHH